MSIIRASVPLRVSIIGGGTDLPEFMWLGKTGACLSVTISKYVHCMRSTMSYVDLSSRSIQITEDINTPLTHSFIDELLEHEYDGVNYVSFHQDVPTKGTGLGSSAAWLKALSLAFDTNPKGFDLYDIERRTGSSCGYQDHAAAMNPGFKLHIFKPGQPHPEYESVTLPDDSWMLRSMCLFRTGGERDSNVILREQSSRVAGMIDELEQLSQEAQAVARAATIDTAESRAYVRRAMAWAWDLKKTYAHGVSNMVIDDYYKAASLTPGFIGGKLLGAGGFGYMMFLTDDKPALRKALSNLLEVDLGEQVIGYPHIDKFSRSSSKTI